MIISGSVLFQPGFRPHPQFTSLNVPGPTTADQTGRSCLDRPSGWSISSLVKGRLGGKCHHDHHGKWARKTPDSACHAVCRASLWTPKSQNRERSHVTSPPRIGGPMLHSSGSRTLPAKLAALGKAGDLENRDHVLRLRPSTCGIVLEVTVVFGHSTVEYEGHASVWIRSVLSRSSEVSLESRRNSAVVTETFRVRSGVVRSPRDLVGMTRLDTSKVE